MSSFRNLSKSVLIGASALQSKFDQGSVELRLVLEEMDRQLPISKQLQIVEYLEEQGWIDQSDSTLEELRLRVTGAGEIEAERLLDEQVNSLLTSGPRVTVRSHDESMANVAMHAGNLDAFSNDRSKISLVVGEPVSPPTIDWGKWGSIAGIVGVPVAVLLWWFS